MEFNQASKCQRKETDEYGASLSLRERMGKNGREARKGKYQTLFNSKNVNDWKSKEYQMMDWKDIMRNYIMRNHIP